MKNLQLARLFLIVTLAPTASFSQDLDHMDKIVSNGNSESPIVASKSSTQNDFDFLVGKWNIHNEKLKSSLSNSNEWIEFEAVQEMRKVLTGIGNVETISATVNDKPYEGMVIRLFDPATRLWSIYWADNNSGTMDNPVVGSFEHGIGTFFGKEIHNGKEIILQFRWDTSNLEKPVWSQAFSADKGRTWEWNWYKHFTRRGNAEGQKLNANQNIKVIELRNYVTRPGRRDDFIKLFEENFTQSQNILGGYTLGQYRVKGADDNFFWIRGFKDMSTRREVLNDFYYGSPDWKQHKSAANSMLLNNDNVHLLKPLNVKDSSNDAEASFNTNWFGQEGGIAVVDFYTSNTKLEKLIEFVKKKYIAILTTSKIENTSFWTSETTPNDFPGLPVFQDKNLLVQMTFYKNELEYQTKMKDMASRMDEESKSEIADLVTIKNTIIIYPTEKSFRLQKE